jgi:MerR family transcriptional regulator, thiopeptide resistance regulator
VQSMGEIDSAELDRSLKIGALAEATGLTVRALHHYDRVGLLHASDRTAAGHRLYSPADVERLYRIVLLRRLNFPLAEIARGLDNPEWELEAVVRRHLEDTQRRVVIASRLQAHLQAMLSELGRAQNPSTDQLLSTLEEMTMLDSTVRATTALLVYNDIGAAQDYLVRVFGLVGGQLERDDTGVVTHGEVRAGDQVIWLHRAGQDFQSPASLGAVTGITVINVDNVDAHHARSVAAGTDIVETPVDQDYGVREYGARDPEGQLWFFHSPLD